MNIRRRAYVSAMGTISVADLRTVMRFLVGAPAVEAGRPFSPAVLQALGDLIPADHVEYFELRRSDLSGVDYTVSRQRDEPEIIFSSQAQGLWRDNPLGAFKWTPDDGPQRLSAVAGSSRIRRLGYYHGYLRPMAVRDQLKVWLWSSAATTACVVLERYDASFGDHDVALLGVLQQHLVARRAAAFTAVPERNPPALTLREAQILTLALAGRGTGAIAELLYIAPGTVRKHLEHVYAKLGVGGRSESLARILQARDSR